jgi:hypothetical protein
MELTFEMADGRHLKAWLSNTKMGQLVLRHAADAVGQLAAYEAGRLTQDMFPGATVRLRLSIRKRRGYPDSRTLKWGSLSYGKNPHNLVEQLFRITY